MGGCVIKTGKRQIVIKMPITPDKLVAIVTALGIPAADRDNVISEISSGGESIHVYVGNRQSKDAPK
jgi:hypothetical protein